MEDRFAQQLKKGVLEMLVLKLICEKPAYGYELLSELKLSSQGRLFPEGRDAVPDFVPPGGRRHDPLPMVNRGGARVAEENLRSHEAGGRRIFAVSASGGNLRIR